MIDSRIGNFIVGEVEVFESLHGTQVDQAHIGHGGFPQLQRFAVDKLQV